MTLMQCGGGSGLYSLLLIAPDAHCVYSYYSLLYVRNFIKYPAGLTMPAYISDESLDSNSSSCSTATFVMQWLTELGPNS